MLINYVILCEISQSYEFSVVLIVVILVVIVVVIVIVAVNFMEVRYLYVNVPVRRSGLVKISLLLATISLLRAIY